MIELLITIILLPVAIVATTFTIGFIKVGFKKKSCENTKK